MTYRLAESGIERIEEGCSTFIPHDPRHPAWREFEAWCACGHKPDAAIERPAFIEPEPPPEPPPPKRLWIIGAGGYGRELFGMAGAAHGSGDQWLVAGFLNDVPDALEGFEGLPAIGGNTDYEPQPDDLFICAIGEVAGRRAVCAKFRGRGARFINLMHRSSQVAPSARLGEGIVVEAFSGIGAHAQIGDFSQVLSHVSIGHDAMIGAYVQVSPFASILGRAEIGDEAFIGSHAVILPEVKIGAGAKVGAGAIVLRDVPAGATVFGVPATRIQ